ncbi:hypothetical protein T01_11064 [Trichinella spiralis]|uniref:Uncharacterized protein n=1 Tax=Trichinella spiralis TaxID=6334 RepID=A0A0V1BSJ1_TRISP|nr:hypothetical protein T01_11064 [Trichinella spiralis]
MEICKHNSGTNVNLFFIIKIFFHNISRNTQSGNVVPSSLNIQMCWATARGTCSTIIPHFITISESCLIMLYPNVYHCHDLETNATKEWHVRNIIPLLKVFAVRQLEAHGLPKRVPIFDCHDLEINATKEWHARNIIPLLKVINQRYASLDRIMVYPNVYDCHDLEINATKEWHARNIIPLLKVINQRYASLDRIVNECALVHDVNFSTISQEIRNQPTTP